MQVDRIIGQYSGKTDGPMLVFTAGIHGNETPGVRALQEVFEILEARKPAINGSIVGFACNLPALEREVRYIDRDLNRLWLSEESDTTISEYNQRDEILETLNEILASQQEDVFFFDLHSTSSESNPFIMLSDTLRNRELGHLVGVPVMLGLLEHLNGMLIDITSRLGFPTLLFQGGGFAQEDTRAHHMGLIWKLLVAKCGLDQASVAESKAPIEKLNQFAPADVDHEFFEIAYSHKLRSGKSFQMNPGYANFQRIKKREVLATANGTEVKAPMSGQIFMPLYQEQGSEGFYIIKPIASFWIRFSRGFRLFKYHHKLNWLLGVSTVSSDPLTFKVDQQVTFLWAVEIFHLLGYIKVREDGPILFMARREDERNPPSAKKAIEQLQAKVYLRSELMEIKSDWRIPFSGKYYMLAFFIADTILRAC